MKIENWKLKIISSLCICLFSYWFIGLFPKSIYASISTNDSWTIEIKDVDITTNKPLNNQKKQITDHLPENIITGKNFKAELGFNGLSPKTPFSFDISNNIIDYGPLSATNQIYRTSNLSISNRGTKGFMVKAYENHVLSNSMLNSFIPDSTCDNGSCSAVVSAPWINILTYGFGYRCDNVVNENCPIDFNSENYYKQFSDYSKSEREQTVMSGNFPVSNNEIQITYKVNISKNQLNGSYTNEITYIAVPNY